MTTAAVAHPFDPEIAAALAPAACAAGAPVIDRGDWRIAGRPDELLVHGLAPAVSGSRLGLPPSMQGGTAA
jgi:hypothetical protein